MSNDINVQSTEKNIFFHNTWWSKVQVNDLCKLPGPFCLQWKIERNVKFILTAETYFTFIPLQKTSHGKARNILHRNWLHKYDNHTLTPFSFSWTDTVCSALILALPPASESAPVYLSGRPGISSSDENFRSEAWPGIDETVTGGVLWFVLFDL